MSDFEHGRVAGHTAGCVQACVARQKNLSIQCNQDLDLVENLHVREMQHGGLLTYLFCSSCYTFLAWIPGAKLRRFKR